MDSVNAYIYDGSLAPAEQVSLSSGTITYLVTDALGSVRGTVGSSGSLTATTSYSAWGAPETTGGLTSATPFGFAGGYTDPDGLIYLLNRYYEPSTGQFISVDPALAQTAEPYEYANSNPTSNVDPAGQWACQWEPSWSSWRTCWVYFSEQTVHTIEWYLWIGVFAATICWALVGPVCGVLDAFIGLVLADVYRSDYGHGEYLNIYEWRWTWEYPSGITWWGRITWSWADGPWLIYWASLSPAW
jgi:RHS repeat-associated protein